METITVPTNYESISINPDLALLEQIFLETNAEHTLRDCLPCGYGRPHLDWANPEVDNLLDEKCLKVHTSWGEVDDLTWPIHWPGPEKWVERWYELQDYAVAWVTDVENDYKISFIVRKLVRV